MLILEGDATDEGEHLILVDISVGFVTYQKKLSFCYSQAWEHDSKAILHDYVKFM